VAAAGDTAEVVGMLLRSVRTDNARGLRLIGEIDVSNGPALRGLLARERKATAGDVTLDLSGLRFIDSSGIRVLLGAARELESEGRRLVVRDVPRGVRRIFDLLGVERAPGVVLSKPPVGDEDDQGAVRRDSRGEPHPVVRAWCACGCPYLYADDDAALFWEPGGRVDPGCVDRTCQCHVSPLRG